MSEIFANFLFAMNLALVGYIAASFSVEQRKS